MEPGPTEIAVDIYFREGRGKMLIRAQNIRKTHMTRKMPVAPVKRAAWPVLASSCGELATNKLMPHTCGPRSECYPGCRRNWGTRGSTLHIYQGLEPFGGEFGG